MKLEIELDLNKIDYDAINKQIQEKLSEMDLSKTYSISSKIDRQIREEVEQRVNSHIGNNSWGGLNNATRKDIKNEITNIIKEILKPQIENIINQIPQEELDNLISELIPKIFVDMITSQMKDVLSSYYFSIDTRIHQICENKIREILNR